MSAEPWLFHPDARAEFDDAIDWYDTQDPGLGTEFLNVVAAATNRAALLPTPGTPVPGVDRSDVRRLLLTPRFPYQIVLLIPDHAIVAVAHLKRRPHYWRQRLQAQ